MEFHNSWNKSGQILGIFLWFMIGECENLWQFLVTAEIYEPAPMAERYEV